MAIITTKKIKPFFSSMRWSMMATYGIVIMITLVLMSIYIIGALQDNLYENERVRLFAKANIIAELVNPHENLQYEQQAQDNVIQVLSGTAIRNVVINPSYQVVMDTNQEANLIGKVFIRDILKKSLSGEPASTVRVNAQDMTMLSVSVPIKRGERVLGAVYLIESISDLDNTVKAIKTSLYLFSGLIIVLVGMLSFGMSYIITSPVDEVILVAREISKGDFSRRVKVKGHDELAQMAETLNFMSSELQNLEENRKKFVSDVSHELKTPLATIKLICDSVVSTENPDPEMLRDFLGDLSDEVDRLTRIVERLLTLTRLGSEEGQPKLTPVDFIVMLNAISKKLTPNANAKNIVLYTNFEADMMEPMLLDYDKIWEAIYNIVDNAIKYSPEGGFVKMSLTLEKGEAIVKVEDNGPGIPESEKDKIFERFYRLDDSRARETGGTGLGLAIAKEAVLLHGGSISVSSEGEMGSIFSIHLPYSPKG
ncbi:MAG: cell wall metabolism sensor histidine kinase WalK [Ruminococcaceae bacterium]|nr:cell wall metabolism sensor histidine kinase WalK [Oscillospiraceae bacterium]